MSEELELPDAKLYKPSPDGGLIPHIPHNQYQLQNSEVGQRLVASTNLDRVDFFKMMLDLYPGPFFITVVAQDAYGAFKQAGRYNSDRGKTRVQVDYFLDHFHDFISYDGFHHLWVSCETSNGIVVFDQHDLFFIYERSLEAEEILRTHGFVLADVLVDFHHAHRTRTDIVPGTNEILDYGTWWFTQLEIPDVAYPEKKSLYNYWLRFRSWRALRRKKRKKRRRLG